MIKNYLINKYITVFEPGCRILYGFHAAAGYLLNFAAEIAVQQPVHLLDFGNRCDMYYVVRQLRYLTRDPAAALQNIRLQRAFTCYQALALLRQIDQMETGLPVIILDMLAPFLDENIKTDEIFRLYQESVDHLRCAMRMRLLLIGVKPVPQKLAPDRVCLAGNLAREFGLIPIEDIVMVNHAELNGYQKRPAMRMFETGRSEIRKQPKAELMDGQLSLFDYQKEITQYQSERTVQKIPDLRK